MHQCQLSQTRDFYPRSPCGERLILIGGHFSTPAISIHALLAESDPTDFLSFAPQADFYPRSPCGERPLSERTDIQKAGFLSTLSLRRATYWYPQRQHRQKNFYPRSPCGERRGAECIKIGTIAFLSTLSLRRATNITLYQFAKKLFLSTLSLRRATISNSPFRAEV